VYFPTRTTATTSSMLDNIFIDKSSNFIIKPHINGLSDHDAQIITLNDETLPPQILQTIVTRSFKKINIANFLNYLSYENWRDVFMENDVYSTYNNFLNIFLRGFNYSFPIYRKHIDSYIQKKWITNGILVSCKRKKELYILNKYTHNQIKKYYKRYCTILSKVILKTKKLYYKQAIEKSNNKIKTTWCIINEEKELYKREPMIKKISHNNRITINKKP
jgi:hypothetical protein